MRLTLFVFLFSISQLGLSQEDTPVKKNFLPIWSFHQKHANIHGISIGLASLPSKPRYNRTNGIKLEVLGLGFFLQMAGESPVVHNDSLSEIFLSKQRSEQINGLSITTLGSFCDCEMNGISIGTFAHYYAELNGIGAAVLTFTQELNGIQVAGFNEVYRSNGLQIGMFINSNSRAKGLMLGGINLSDEFKGVQVGIVNSSKKTKGIQLGLWNINERRQFPFINWNFKIQKTELK